MKITYTYVVNGYNLKNNAVSVTYTATDSLLGLRPYTIQQLGVNLDDADEVIAQIVLASTAAQYEWNKILDVRDKVASPDIEALIGREIAPTITETSEIV